MKISYPVIIEGPCASCSWIPEFIKEVRKAGGDIRHIAHFDTFQELRSSWNKANEDFKDAKKEADTVIELLLHPRFHKIYLKSVAGLYPKLKNDPRSIVVYDYNDIPSTSVEEIHVVTIVALDIVLKELRKEFGEHRILDRRQAIIMLAEKLALQNA